MEDVVVAIDELVEVEVEVLVAVVAVTKVGQV